ncbi:MAG: DUF4364 family protein [Eubacterium sp.]|jgi:DNA-binding PadR family transcriptional regulator|uniref:DUF4364 family protein n=1 Tax=Clostridium sp. (strain SY8519) TaxID=1042156 RepID=UPI0002171A80|nr:DUF4364 family protein [Clostridium sp. SY8519]BAK48076.1 hypothetical protein CXIVA_21090 [Clostridium sp. SY8519]
MADLKTLYRLIILYMLANTKLPLSNTQITGFMLDQEYTNYFIIQKSFSDLEAADLISSEPTYSNTFYQITEEGRYTLELFQDKISDSIKHDVHEFLSANDSEIHREAEASADYYSVEGGRYEVRCRIRSGSRSILDLTLEVSTKEQAAAISRNWSSGYIDAYTGLMDLLLK